ncbi:hypothetical protein D043_4829B, partial [Vibrio parahaemolyticus EKP-021]
YWK